MKRNFILMISGLSLWLKVPAALTLVSTMSAFSSAAMANVSAPPNGQGSAFVGALKQQRQQERERAILKNITPQADAYLPRPKLTSTDYPSDEQPCFRIASIRLQGKAASQFQWALQAVKDARGRCLGEKGYYRSLIKCKTRYLRGALSPHR